MQVLEIDPLLFQLAQQLGDAGMFLLRVECIDEFVSVRGQRQRIAGEFRRDARQRILQDFSSRRSADAFAAALKGTPS